MFVVRDAPQRTRRQPSRNLAQTLQAARLRASDLMGQQVNGKGHNGVKNRTAVHQFTCMRQRPAPHTQMRSWCKLHVSQAATRSRTAPSKPQDQARFNWSSKAPIDAKIASKDGASPTIIVSVICRSYPHARPSLHVTRARRSNLPCSHLITPRRIRQWPTQNLLHPDWHGWQAALQVVQ